MTTKPLQVTLQDVLYLSPCKTAFVLSDDSTRTQRVYRKELIYPGHFVKMRPGLNEPEIEFDVTEDSIDHWVDTFAEMQKNGVTVPLTLQHSTDPEDRRGTVVDLRKEYNPKRGTNSLYMYVTFRDVEAEKLAKTTCCSLFAPAEYTDGKNNRYYRPIRHVALTDYPVIPGLDGFQPLAASFDGDDPFSEADVLDLSEVDKMNLAQVARKLGQSCKDDDNPLDIANSIVRAWNRRERRLAQLEDALKKQDEDERKRKEAMEAANDDEDDDEDDDEEINITIEDDDEEDDVEAGDNEDEDEDDDDVEAGDDEDEDDEEDDEDEVEFSFDDLISKAAKKSRKRRKSLSLSEKVVSRECKHRALELAALVRSQAISPAVAKRLAKRYCNPKKVALSLSNDAHDDGFDSLISDLTGNKALRLGERSGPQLRRGESNPLLADAERRSKGVSQ